MKLRTWKVTAIAFLLVLTMVFPASAQGSLNYGSNTLGSLSAEASLAFYSFNGSTGDLVNLQVIEVTPGMSPSVSLLGPNQQLISSIVAPEIGPDAGEARLSVRLVETGVFSILVSSAAAVPGDFLLRLSGTPPVVATPVSAGVPIAADLVEGGLVQVFAVDALPDAVQPVVVSTSSPGLTFIAQLIGPTGAIVGTLSGGEGMPVSLGVPPGQGVYELWVTSALPGTVSIALGEPQSLPGAPAAAPVAQPADPAATEEVTVADPTSAPAAATCVLSSTTNVNLRIGPGTENPVVGVLIPGATQPVAGVSPDGAWYALLISGQTVWVSADVVAVEGACDQVPVVQAGQSAPAPAATEEVTAPGGSTATATATGTGAVNATLAPTVTSSATQPQAAATQEVSPPTVTSSPTQPQVAVTQDVSPPTATLSNTLAPTQTATVVVPTVTATPLPTQTSTVVPPTATFTPTTPPAAQIAPEDPRFNSPLNIPLDSTSSVLDFVSYPGGDTEDRVRWDITGMNQTPSLSGGRARLVISLTCFGEGTDQIQVFTGGQTYSCGQTIVDREVTAASRTGSAIITAVGGSSTYVQWVLTGTATRVN